MQPAKPDELRSFAAHRRCSADLKGMAEQERLVKIVRSTPWLMRALEAVRSVEAPDACIGAGALRAAVWDALHQFAASSSVADVDVAYFDRSDLSRETEERYRHQLAVLEPGYVWDVVNRPPLQWPCGSITEVRYRCSHRADSRICSAAQFGETRGVRASLSSRLVSVRSDTENGGRE